MLTFTIACIGMTQIIIYGSIFDRSAHSVDGNYLSDVQGFGLVICGR